MDPPRFRRIDSVTESSISISWNDPYLDGEANTILWYLVMISPDDSFQRSVQGTNANITGLTSNKEYTIRVEALGSDERYGTALQTSVITSVLTDRHMIRIKWFHLLIKRF